jgi:hypothetical protein
MNKNQNWTSETAPKGKGKSFRKYSYTIQDIADLSTRAIQTIRNDISKGILEPGNLESVYDYISESKERSR